MKFIQFVAMSILTIALLWGYIVLISYHLADLEISQDETATSAVVVMIFAQIVWAFVAGAMIKPRGWRLVESGLRPLDLAGNVILSGTIFWAPFLIGVWYSFFKRGKWFPTPSDCSC